MKKPRVIELLRNFVNSGYKLYPLLNFSAKNLIDYIDKQDNIINEFDKWLKAKQHLNFQTFYIQDAIDKLQELKGVDKK